MSLKPDTWRRSSPWLSTRVVALLSCSSFVTSVGVVLSVAWLALLFFTHDYESSPPFMVAVATVTALTWIWRMQIARVDREERADEELIEAFAKKVNVEEARLLREEAAFREITRRLNEEA
jgi:MFS superfamily sulfate permease-like transporter